MNTMFYYLNIVAGLCHATITINGFPLENSEINYNNYNNQFLLNEFLIGKNNLLIIEVSFASEQDIALIKSFQINGTLKQFFEGDVVTPEDGKIIPLTKIVGSETKEVSSIGFGDEDINIEEKFIRLQYSFDNDKYNYSHLFCGNPININKDQLTNYGQKLINLFIQKDTYGFYNEYRNKANDMAIARGKTLKEVEPVVLELIEQAMRQGLIRIPEQINVRSWCNDRIFELYVLPDRNLITTREDSDGMDFDLPVFITLINDKLKIIR